MAAEKPFGNKAIKSLDDLDKIKVVPEGGAKPAKPEQKANEPKKEEARIDLPPKPTEKPAKEPERLEDVTNFAELYNFLNKTDSGRSITYDIMGLINNARELSAHDKFVRYVKFMATLNDPALKQVLSKLLITNDPALSQVQKEEDEKRKQQEKANFSIENAVATQIRNLQGMKPKKRRDHINKTLTDAYHAQEEYPGFFEALNDAYTKFLEEEGEKKTEKPENKKIEINQPPKPEEELLATDEIMDDAPVPVLEPEKIKVYEYVALNGRMEKKEGTVEAFNEKEALQKVKDMALIPDSLKLVGEKKSEAEIEKEKAQEITRLQQIIENAKRKLEANRVATEGDNRLIAKLEAELKKIK